MSSMPSRLFLPTALLTPSMASSYPREWVATIQAAEALSADMYVPGHGFVDAPAVSREELNNLPGAIQGIITDLSGELVGG